MKQYNCQNCGKDMLYIQYVRSKFCETPACQRARVQVDIIEQANKAKETLINAAVTHQSSLGNEQTPDELQQQAIIAVLPVNNRYITELEAHRKKAFKSHVASILEDVSEKQVTRHKTYVDELEPEDDEQTQTLLNLACSTCKGHCCGLGDTHAFLDYHSLALYKEQNKDLSNEEILERYEQYLPDVSYQAACVMQTKNGCNLPADMRSITCRNYKCKGLTDIQQNIKTQKSNLIYAGAIRGGNVLNVSVFDETQFNYIIEEPTEFIQDTEKSSDW